MEWNLTREQIYYTRENGQRVFIIQHDEKESSFELNTYEVVYENVDGSFVEFSSYGSSGEFNYYKKTNPATEYYEEAYVYVDALTELEAYNFYFEEYSKDDVVGAKITEDGNYLISLFMKEWDRSEGKPVHYSEVLISADGKIISENSIFADFEVDDCPFGPTSRTIEYFYGDVNEEEVNPIVLNIKALQDTD